MIRFSKSSRRNVVALSWDQGQLQALVAAIRGNAIDLIDVITIEFDRDETPEETGKRLAAKLKELRVSSFQLLVGLPRSQVEQVQLSLPMATKAELPDLVRNEVMRRLSDLPDDTVIDFVELPEIEPDLVRIEALVLRPETSLFLNEIGVGVGRAAAQIVLRPLAVASLFDRLTGEEHVTSLLLNLVDDSADMSILKRGRVQFSRSVRLAAETSEDERLAKVVDEIRRTIAVAPIESRDDSNVQHIYMFGDFNQGGSRIERMADLLEMPVSVLDPLVGIQLRSNVDSPQVYRFTALIGIVRDFAEGQPPIDFANPKRPPKPPRYGRKIAFYVTVAAVVLAIVGWQFKTELDAANADFNQVSADFEQQTKLLEKLRSRTFAVDAVARWRTQEIHWLNELQELSAEFPPADQAVVQNMSMTASNNGLGVVSMSVRVKDPAIIGQMESTLRDQAHQVTSRRISQASDKRAFPCQFETSISVRPNTNE
ncbi:MAG: hypothetical protein P8N76_02950 [Pirellulaceae bacterium]|nr:hypothetical protein [Pirellulaceae bacterium]